MKEMNAKITPEPMGTCLFIFKDYYKNFDWRGDKLELLAMIMNDVLWPSINNLLLKMIVEVSI